MMASLVFTESHLIYADNEEEDDDDDELVVVVEVGVVLDTLIEISKI